MVTLALRTALGGLLLLLALPALAKEVTLEVELSEANPYVRQLVIYTLRLVSSVSLETAEVEPPLVPGLVLKALGKPNSYHRPVGTLQQVVTEYRYTLVPLKPGLIKIPAAGMKVTTKGSNGYYSPWQQSAPQTAGQQLHLQSEPLLMEVRPAQGSLVNWLPLYRADLRGELINHLSAKVGEPITLLLTLEAVGIGGADLPDLAPYLQGDDFKIYPEQPLIESYLSPDGKMLLGRRVERFTLVPQRPGRQQLPAVRLPWWNINLKRSEDLVWRTKSIEVTGDESEPPETLDTTELATEGFGSALLTVMAIFLFGIVLFVAGWWVGAGGSKLTWRRQLSEQFSGFRFKASAQWLATLFVWMLPRATRGRIAKAIRERLPLDRFVSYWQRWSGGGRFGFSSLRLRRQLRQAVTVAEVAAVVESYALIRLKMVTNTPLLVIAEKLLARFPMLKRTEIVELFGQLDRALFAGQSLDLESWKREFNRLQWQLLFARQRSDSDSASRGLPLLNPRR